MRSVAGVVLLAVAVAAGLGLRLAPVLRDPGFSFAYDGLYHERLTREVVEHGRLAPTDSLSEFPIGRVVTRHLPTGLYHAGAALHRALGGRDLRWSLALLVALTGALIAVPAWIGARVLFGDPRVAALAAALAVFVPAHVIRTLGVNLRYDAPGSLLATLHAVLALASLRESRAGRARVLAAASALVLVAAMATWRVSLLVLELELAAAAIVFLLHGASRATRDLWLAIALAGWAGFPAIGYLGAHHFLLSPLWLGVTGFALLQAVPALGPGSHAGVRAGALAGVAIAAFAAGQPDTSGDYAGLGAMLRARLGLGTTDEPDAALMLGVSELRGMALRRFLTGSEVMSWLGIAFALSPLGFAALRTPGARTDLHRWDPATVTFVVLATGLGLATLLFQRSVVLLAPIAAITVAGLIGRAVLARPAPGDASAGARPAGKRPARGTPRRAPFAAGRAVRGAVAACAAAAALSGVVSGVAAAGTGGSRPAPSLLAAIGYLGTHAAPGEGVLCDWDSGYEIQSLIRRPTVVDGLLESAENRRRIVGFYRALMSPDAAPLEAICRRDGVRWLLMPPSSAIGVIAAVSGDPVAAVIARGEAVPRGPMTDHLIVHLLENPAAAPGMRRVFTAGAWSVYRIGD